MHRRRTVAALAVVIGCLVVGCTTTVSSEVETWPSSAPAFVIGSTAVDPSAASTQALSTAPDGVAGDSVISDGATAVATTHGGPISTGPIARGQTGRSSSGVGASTAVSSRPPGSTSARSAAPVGPRLFGLAVTGGGGDAVAAAQSTAGGIGRRLDVIGIYQAWVWKGDFPEGFAAAAQRVGAAPMITFEPWDPAAGVNQSAYRLSAIASGQFDGYLRGWAAQAGRHRGTVYLRFAHEQNGHWYPWAVGVNGNSADDYLAAYRHVRAIFRAAGASNVEFVWSPNVIDENNAAVVPATWPGPADVDVIGIDGYNTGSSIGAPGWTWPVGVFGPTLAAVNALGSNLPVWITETASTGSGTDRATWTSALISYLRSTDVSCLLWFDVNDTAARRDWRLELQAPGELSAESVLRGWR